MRIINLTKITILAIIMGLMLTANSYAGDLEVTMDVVRQSDADNIMDSITREISLPKGDMESVGKKHDNRSLNQAVEDGHHMNEAMEGCQQMKDHMNDAMGDSQQMRDHMNDAMGDGNHMNDHMNDAVEDGQPMHGNMNGSMR